MRAVTKFEFRWTDREIEVQRAVNLPMLGTIGFQPVQNGKRLAYVKFNDMFMKTYGLTWHRDQAEMEAQTEIVMGPLIKPNFAVMAKAAQMERGVFHQTLLNIF